MVVNLHLKKKVNLPIDGTTITPNIFAGKSDDEISQLLLWKGNRKVPIMELFTVKGSGNDSPNEVAIRIEGDLFNVNRVGSGMTEGEISIEGNVGMHLGLDMQGGKITVSGSTGSWLGASMQGGTIEVKGNTGDYVGAPYRGSIKGMKGGTIVVHGNAGTEVGSYLRNGFIKIDGNVEQFVGIHQKKGTIFIGGDAGSRAGAFMTGGKIIVCGHIESLLPTFTIDSLKKKVKIKEKVIEEPFYLFVGDSAEYGKGKLYVLKSKNKHLKDHEGFLQKTF